MTCNMRFVFLFKQKTAYEMRISDWSSDVCLDTQAAVVGQRGQAGKIRRLKRLQFGIGDEAGAGFFRLRQTEFRRRYGLYAKGAEKFPDLADLAGIRSEEHTSELQSLMRISYAVFCLKKKINNINHT